MKVNAKKASKTNGKVTTKDVKPGTQTITSMFKRQIASTNTNATIHCSPTKSISSDDDVKIIKVETQSPYFSQSSCDKCEDNKPQTRRKLSLRKSTRSKSSRDEISVVTNTISVCPDVVGIKNEKCLKESSSLKTGLDKTEKDEKLTLRKRKSNTIQDNDCKKSKISSESPHGLTTEKQCVEKTEKDGNMPKSTADLKVNEENKNDLVLGTPMNCNELHEDTNTSKLVLENISKEKKGREKKGLLESVHHMPSASKLTVNSTDTPSTQEGNENEENSQPTEDLDNDPNPEFRTPYYLENFRTVLNTVLEDEHNVNLYNSDDMDVISTFNELSESAQKLYLRLFCRKWSWLPLNKIKYPGIADDLRPVSEELIEKKLFTTDTELLDLKTILKLLPGGDIKTLGKMYHINGPVSQNKADAIDLLIKKTKQNTIGSMFKMVGNSPETVMLNRAKKLLGTCIYVAEGPRDVFARTMMLFSLTDTVLDEDSSGQTLQLFQMLRVNIGQITYPVFTVNKKTQIFPDRNAVLRFCEASLLEFDILTKLEKNKYIEAFSIYEEAVKQYDKLTQDKQVIEFDKKLPVFLRPYTACAVYTRALNQGVEILQRRKDYPSAVDLLKKLLSQDCYCQHYRGHWWERLALNYDTHLKKPDLALQAAEDGLADKLVKTGRRLALYQRAQKICTAVKSKFKTRMKNFYHDELVELPVVTIDGQTLSDCIQGQKYKFMIHYSQGEGQVETDDIAFCGVEEVVLDHYKHNGFTDGIHAEGSVISCLFGLFFWEILFMDVPDAFHSPYQTHPLDVYTEEFYFNRQTHIDKRLEIIQNSSDEDLKKMMSETWTEHEGTMCGGLNWERFNNLQHAQGLVECIGGKALSGILGRYAKDPRHTRSGFPDLTLWNTDTKHFKISEVKGPGDKLSHKQIMWLDFLLKLGVDAEVCHVKAVGSKRLKKNPSIV